MPTSVALAIVGEAVKASLFNTAKVAIDELNQLAVLSQGKNVLNGSFEFDNEVVGTPDGWFLAAGPGASWELETTIVADGAQSLKMIAAVGGLVSAINNNFITLSGDEDTVYVKGMVRQSAASSVYGDVKFYDEDQVLIATTRFMTESSGLPSLDTWYPIRGDVDAPSTARYYKITLTAPTGLASNVYWDGIETNTKPFDWVFDFQTITSGMGAGLTTKTISAVGFPKYAWVRQVTVSTTTNDTTFLGWDGAAFDTDLVLGDSFKSVAAGDSIESEVALNATGQFQQNITNTTGSSGDRTLYQVAYR